MAELSVSFSSGGFSRSVKSLNTSLQSRFDDYNGIKKVIGQVPTCRTNLSASGSYLQVKMNSINEHKETLEKFRNNVVDFCDTAKSVDKGIANRIKDSSKSTYKILGIKTGLSAVLHSIIKSGVVKGLVMILCPVAGIAITIIEHKDDIKKWYKDKFIPWWDGGGKYIVAVIVGIAAVTIAFVSCGAALAAIGPALAAVASATTMGATITALGSATAAFVSAGVSCFLLYNYSADCICDTVALSLHLMGNESGAEEWSQKGGKEGFEFVGSMMDKVFQTDSFFTDVLGNTHSVLTLFSAVWSIGTTAFKSIKTFSDKGFWNGLKSITHIKVGNTDSLKSVYGVSQNAFITFKSTAEATNFLMFSDYFKTAKGLYDVTKAYNNGNYLIAFGGAFGGDLDKICNTAPKVVEGIGYLSTAKYDAKNYTLKIMRESMKNRLFFNIPAMVRLAS